MDRVVIFHFHLFKNAGTSVDKILEMNFNDKWIEKEFSTYSYYENITEVVQFIMKTKDKIAYSSHTARLFKFWELEKIGIKVIPLIFVRHPLIRIHSAYLFEKEKQKDLETLEVTIARNTSLKGYTEIRWLLPGDFQTKNFHISRFSDLFYEDKGTELDKALKALEILPYVGLVEKFEESLKKMEKLIMNYFPEFKAELVYENVNFPLQILLNERLDLIKKEVGEEFFEKMYLMNKEDIIFWEKVVELYGGLN